MIFEYNGQKTRYFNIEIFEFNGLKVFETKDRTEFEIFFIVNEDMKSLNDPNLKIEFKNVAEMIEAVHNKLETLVKEGVITENDK